LGGAVELVEVAGGPVLVDVAQGDDVLGGGDVVEVAAPLSPRADDGDVESFVGALARLADLVTTRQPEPGPCQSAGLQKTPPIGFSGDESLLDRNGFEDMVPL